MSINSPHDWKALYDRKCFELEACKAELTNCRQELCELRQRGSQNEAQNEAKEFSNLDRQGGCIARSIPADPSISEDRHGDKKSKDDHLLAHNTSIISDLLQFGDCLPLEFTMDELVAASEAHDLAVTAWSFVQLEGGESLQQHVSRRLDQDIPIYPSQEGIMSYVSPACIKQFNVSSAAEAERFCIRVMGSAHFRQEWQARLKNLLAGNYQPMVVRTVLFAHPGRTSSVDQSSFKNTILWSTVVVDSRGRRYWGLLLQIMPLDPVLEHIWGMRDFLTIKHTPACISIISKDTGRLLWQNSASMAMFGCQGLFHSEIHFGSHLPPTSMSEDTLVHGGSFDFLEALFGSRKEKFWFEDLDNAVVGGGYYRSQVSITDNKLRVLMGLKAGEEAHHDVQVSQSQDPVTLQRVLTISQVDVTPTVLAQRQLQQAHAELAEEKVRTEALMCRQRELIECIGWVSQVGRSAAGDARSAELIDRVWQQMIQDGGRDHSVSCGAPELDDIELMELMGEGSYGKVFRGKWKGHEVAVKSMVLPIKLSGAEHRERMAIMEAAISSSLSHPNIVKTHTYSLKPVRESVSSLSWDGGKSAIGFSVESSFFAGCERSSVDTVRSSPGGSVSAFQVQIVQELCDRGSLREALDLGLFHGGPEGDDVNYPTVLETALDVARGMRHLHSCNILHSDLKALNVLLQSCSNSSLGFTAKVADFGLSVKMLHSETHVSNMFQGTMSHMAPETMLTGQQSNAADVYAFGITLWELYTGQHAFEGVPQTMLGHLVAHEHIRPQFPPGTPCELEVLAELCWQNTAALRPSFEDIEGMLTQMRGVVGPSKHMVHNITAPQIARSSIQHSPSILLSSVMFPLSEEDEEQSTFEGSFPSSPSHTVNSNQDAPCQIPIVNAMASKKGLLSSFES
ncbi:hypothetical protein CEUSTIGMA_g7582.t1 [Chlamydomonas eustigma]|uniref:Protein kinase domain-containing protein n=1 Tax=Chlamydomonas eustigma TaxID=1157962 RepID=A0A250XAQ6_9CHLO|nr:hypothetical protein CEUSTIGMA_g7582.t1 [Chlamydomonas eustigma]|eukprot:GAX80144.1 hypothetical protein CEUSTIGMA_g7582.t1 [Chlamydomonas eustigma]